MSSSGKVNGWVVTPSIVSVICLAPRNLALLEFIQLDQPQRRTLTQSLAQQARKGYLFDLAEFWDFERCSGWKRSPGTQGGAH